MKELIFNNWSFMRVVRLLAGIAIIIQMPYLEWLVFYSRLWPFLIQVVAEPEVVTLQ